MNLISSNLCPGGLPTVTPLGASLDAELSLAFRNDYRDNYDWRRFGPPKRRALLRVADRIIALHPALVEVGFRCSRSATKRDVMDNLALLDAVRARLADEESRALLVRLLAFRLLGHTRVKLPLNTPSYWKTLELLDSHESDGERLDVPFLGWSLRRMSLNRFGYAATLFVRPPAVYAQFILEQYRCCSAGRLVEAASGDVVIDAGGCYGDSAHYFAHRVGPTGRVFSVEFLEDNLAVFRRNLAMNPELASRISLVERPLWSASGVPLFVEGNGPAARVVGRSSDASAKCVTTASIDDLVAGLPIERVDFIKMDIEGAEMRALEGAEATIRAFRPKLAISVYHRLSDFWNIPTWIARLGLGYHLFIRHFTIHAEETVLFGWPENRRERR